MNSWRPGLLHTALSAAIGAIVGAAVVLYLARPIDVGVARAGGFGLATRNTALDDPSTTSSLVQAVYQQANPGVVSIVATLEPTTSQFFTSPQPEQGAGSGFVVDLQGNIVTNDHVVDGANQLKVTFSDGTSVPAKVIGQDPGDDLALVRVDLSTDRLHPLTLGDSSLVQVGQPAVAIGNPFNLHNTVTAGIVSAIGRGRTSLNGREIPDMIQTDAPANPGNSGGPLLDGQGNVIGVLTQIESPVRGSVGVGFAVPSNTVLRQLTKLIAGGTIHYPWLGVSGEPVTADLARRLNLTATDGVYVDAVIPGGPAEAAGVRAAAPTGPSGTTGAGGDVITALDGTLVHSIEDVGAILASHNPGDTVSLTVIRGANTLTLTATLGTWPDRQPSG
jgi:S1-C subfamily serine protease